ncbi:MAG: S9 family peptidase [Prevotellaceae bacterium]|jgi:dipeptidyl-peptidase-4|nr:S9 family peptidase [Prevotellaceae bacterium]
MKRILITSLYAFSIISSYSHDYELLYKITDGEFRPAKYDIPRSMNDGEHYTLLVENKYILKYSYKTGQVVDTVLDIAHLRDESPMKTVLGYEFCPEEKRILVYENAVYRYRRSFTADYYVFEIARNELTPLSEYGAQEAPLFSPDGRYIAFARENNLYLKKMDFGTESAITKDGEAGKTINGIADWVYEEEFGQVRYFAWSPDSKMLAYVKFDESDVKEFTMPMYLTPKPETDEEVTLYPNSSKIKYPKAGENNSIVSVCVYDDYYKSTKTMKLDDSKHTDFYIPRIKWTNSEEQLAVFRLNRNQNRLEMFLSNPKSTLSKLILTEEDNHYVDYSNIDKLQFIDKKNTFITLSERDGYRHVYQYGTNGNLMKQLTKGNWDVTDVYGYDTKNDILYYQSAETSPLRRDIYSVNKKGKKTRLTNGSGTHIAYFNKTLSCFIDNFSKLETPNKLSLYDANGKQIRVIEENTALLQKFNELQLPKKEFFSFTTSENIELNGWVVKPEHLETDKKYPLLLVQYSGPDSQEVRDRWNVGWEYYLAENGYVVACIDGRGTAARGSEFRKCTCRQLGILETKDQIAAAEYFARQSYIDESRIGIWGWSFGGFMTLMALSSDSIFRAGIAVAPVTDWRFYNTAYTERFMRRPQENFKGYENSSPLLNVNNLNGNLLIIHGTADDNVHVQNTMTYIQRLVEADKQFEMQLYTDKNHSILGKQTRRHLYRRMSDFLFKNL